MAKVPKGGALKVCIATADFWGLKAAGGTATAYHLMAAALAKHKSFQARPAAASPAKAGHAAICTTCSGLLAAVNLADTYAGHTTSFFFSFTQA